MSKIKLILPACFIAFFACSCSEKVTGTTEDENTVIAQGESSSSEIAEPEPSEPESSSSASKTPNNPETIEQHIYAIIDTNTRDILIGGEYGGIGGIGCGGIGGIATATTSTTLNLITLDSVLGPHRSTDPRRIVQRRSRYHRQVGTARRHRRRQHTPRAPGRRYKVHRLRA